MLGWLFVCYCKLKNRSYLHVYAICALRRDSYYGVTCPFRVGGGTCRHITPFQTPDVFWARFRARMLVTRYGGGSSV
jgi:hypothetical protein